MNKVGRVPSLHRSHLSTVTQPNEMQTWLQNHQVRHRYGLKVLSHQRAATLGNPANIWKLSLAISPVLYSKLFFFPLHNSTYASFHLQRLPWHRHMPFAFWILFLSVALSFLECISLAPPSYGLTPHKDSWLGKQEKRKGRRKGGGKKKRNRRKLIILKSYLCHISICIMIFVELCPSLKNNMLKS